VRHYRRGMRGAWSLGVNHGKFCLGCCRALMLLMFGLGVGHLLWMAGLAGIMLLERTRPVAASRAYRGRHLPDLGLHRTLAPRLAAVRPDGRERVVLWEF
jgi:predicted metal-binding membrane protein